MSYRDWVRLLSLAGIVVCIGLSGQKILKIVLPEAFASYHPAKIGYGHSKNIINKHCSEIDSDSDVGALCKKLRQDVAVATSGMNNNDSLHMKMKHQCKKDLLLIAPWFFILIIVWGVYSRRGVSS